MKPTAKPSRAHFSSGPCAKRPGWSASQLDLSTLGRSHRSREGKALIAGVIAASREVLGVPETHRLGIVPGSDTGAFEMAMWSLLGARGVDVLVWDAFSAGWASDVRTQLGLGEARVLEAPYGELPDLGAVDPDRDTVFVWNGTTAGVCVPDGDWIAADRAGLTLCDATSAAFAMDLPWDKLDVVTYSWQKCLGGEAAHGVIVLGPRAVERLESHRPAWPLPKVFRLTKGGRLIEGVFDGATINTPSLMCVADQMDALEWARGLGGLPGLRRRAQGNLACLAAWVEATAGVEFLAAEPRTRSCTSACLKLTAGWFTALPEDEQHGRIKRLAGILADEGVAWDIAGYRDAPPGLRVWTGPTVEQEDLAALLPWLEWGLEQIR